MSMKETREAMEQAIHECEAFEYAYRPDLSVGKGTRYVFADKVVIGLTAAYTYAINLQGKNADEAYKDTQDTIKLSGEFGKPKSYWETELNKIEGPDIYVRFVGSG